ncbi:MAG: class I SAM-dependent methyltransferase [Candidatus Doudnabacteria bacterium]|nr:class I SAM-dependent methyltransferase [Candidatus Doudnabacteria bacterium]
MLLESFKKFTGYELLDTGDGQRLERWGNIVLARPDPQIIWEKSEAPELWQSANAVFKAGGGEDKGSWKINKPIPKSWTIDFQNCKFLLKLSPFKHTGIFAEQAANWEWMLDKLSSPSGDKVIKQNRKDRDLINLEPDNLQLTNKFKVLNLFAYTGGATMVLAKAGAVVTHVDASKPTITWANENHKLNKLPKESVRWIFDDAVKFATRELKRGAKYDGIIMDPPAFGHSPTGKTWRFNDDLPGLLETCIKLLSPNAKFLLINGYATNSSALSLNNLLESKTKNLPGKIEFGELCLKQKSGRTISTGIFTRWSK